MPKDHYLDKLLESAKAALSKNPEGRTLGDIFEALINEIKKQEQEIQFLSLEVDDRKREIKELEERLETGNSPGPLF